MKPEVQTYQFELKRYADYHHLNDPSLVALCRKSQKVIEQASAPYSQFRVGSALLMEDGQIITGSNQENAVYPLGLCAERVALFTAAHQDINKKVLALAVATESSLTPGDLPAFPCGSCRQVILETEYRQKNQIMLLVVGSDHSVSLIPSVQDILPFGFTKDNL